MPRSRDYRILSDFFEVEVEADVFGKKDSIQEFEAMRTALKRAERFGDEEGETEMRNDATANNYNTPSQVVSPARPANVPTPNTDRSSIVSIGSTWNGTLKIDGSVRVEGQLSGEIEARDTVWIAEGAEVDAKVRASVVSIAGRFQGQVDCSERLEITPTGRVKAELATKSLVVHEGAIVEGQIQMLDTKPAPRQNGNAQSERPNGVAPKNLVGKAPSLTAVGAEQN